MLKRVALLGLAALIWWQAGWAEEGDPFLPRAREILSRVPVVDGHNDLPWVIRGRFGGDVEGYDLSRRAQYDTDIPRLREGQVGAQFWSVYVPSALTPQEAMVASPGG